MHTLKVVLKATQRNDMLLKVTLSKPHLPLPCPFNLHFPLHPTRPGTATHTHALHVHAVFLYIRERQVEQTLSCIANDTILLYK